jgi:hypothetical protein
MFFNQLYHNSSLNETINLLFVTYGTFNLQTSQQSIKSDLSDVVDAVIMTVL